MSIKENQLPTAQEVTENNLIRTVDENGASQNMTVEQLGGLVGGGGSALIVEYEKVWDDEKNDYVYTPSKSTAEIAQAYNSGIPVFATIVTDGYRDGELPLLYAYEDEAFYAIVSVNLDEHDNSIYNVYGYSIDHREFVGEELSVIETRINDQNPFGNFAPIVLTFNQDIDGNYLTGGYGDMTPGYPETYLTTGRDVVYVITNNNSYYLYQLFEVDNGKNKYYFMHMNNDGTITVTTYEKNSNKLVEVTS